MKSEKLITKKLLFCKVLNNSQHPTMTVFLENFLRYSEHVFLKKLETAFKMCRRKETCLKPYGNYDLVLSYELNYKDNERKCHKETLKTFS